MAEQMKKTFDAGIAYGALIALQVMKLFDNPVQAEELIRAIGGIEVIKKAAKATENDTDVETLDWLKRNGLNED